MSLKSLHSLIQNIYSTYYVESQKDFIRLGDVMAILAECQHRHELGVDGSRYTLDYWVELSYSIYLACESILTFLDSMDDNVSIKVALLHNAQDERMQPAFSLRRIERPDTFLFELIPHIMTSKDGRPFDCNWGDKSRETIPFSCPGKYKANLVVVKDHSVGYLANCKHIYRLLSDI